MTPSQNTIFLIDAHGFLHRNYHALPKLSTSSGQEVGALYGFVRWLLKLRKEKNPAYVAVCFDSPGGCARRKALLPTYKANRKKPDDALISQLNLARDLVREMGFAVVAKEGIEADDLMAFIAQRAQEAGMDSVLVTADKDVYQFLTPHISIWPSGGKDGFKGPEAAVEKFGVETRFLPDYFAIVGDASDNVPGMAGIGPKTAVELIHKFGHLEDIIRAAQNDNPDLKPALAKKIVANIENGLLSKQLVVLDRNLQMDVNLADYTVRQPDIKHLADLFAQYEFKNLLDAFETQKAKVEIFRQGQQLLPLSDVLKKAAAAPAVFMYTEDDLLVLAVNEQDLSVTPIADIEPWNLDALKKIVADNAVEKIGYDLKLTLRELDIDLNGNFITCFDGRLARYVLDPSGDLSFNGVCAHYFASLPAAEDPRERLALYNLHIWKLKDVLTQELKEKNVWELYQTMELPLMAVLADMERIGLRIDPLWLNEFKLVLEKEIARLQEEIDKTAGYAVNINSTKQLGALLFEQLRIPPVKKTKTGYSTDEEVLAQIAVFQPIAQQILDYRSNSKLKSTYVDNLLLMADEHNKVHSYLDQTGTVTGRLSSSSPNLQNIPVRTEKGRQLRRAFCAGEGNVLLSVDYSQIDLRVLAHESQDPVLVQAFVDGGDIHLQTASQIFNVMPLMVTEQMRSSAKAVNFGIIYGQGPMGLAQSLNIPIREAKEYIDNYFKTYQGVRRWIDQSVSSARANGFVKTMLGHIRYLPEFNMGVGNLAAFAQRAAVNTIVQGGSADIIKKAMIDVFKQIRQTDVQMVMQVHDELIFEVPEHKLRETALMIKEKMQNAIVLRVPLLVSAKAGKNWYALEKLSL